MTIKAFGKVKPKDNAKQMLNELQISNASEPTWFRGVAASMG